MKPATTFSAVWLAVSMGANISVFQSSTPAVVYSTADYYMHQSGAEVPISKLLDTACAQQQGATDWFLDASRAHPPASYQLAVAS